MSNTVNILHLYPNEMNTYGDRGNILTLTKRIKWHGLNPNVIYHHPGKPFPSSIDLVFGGGGQDSAQSDIQKDILKIGSQMHKLAEKEVPMLMICGMYQLLGHKFITHDKKTIKGIGIFDTETHATNKRLIGNLAVDTEDFGILYGFENHSGQTYLSLEQSPLGKVIRGNGNDATKKYEGARSLNVIGSYMHGPLLPLNPRLADWLIYKATLDITKQKEIDDSYAIAARKTAKARKY